MTPPLDVRPAFVACKNLGVIAFTWKRGCCQMILISQLLLLLLLLLIVRRIEIHFITIPMRVTLSMWDDRRRRYCAVRSQHHATTHYRHRWSDVCRRRWIGRHLGSTCLIDTGQGTWNTNMLNRLKQVFKIPVRYFLGFVENWRSF